MSIDDFAKTMGYVLLYKGQNLPFPAQIVVIGELNPKTHSSLRILTDHAEAEDVKRFLEQAEKRKRPGERDNIDAGLQAMGLLKIPHQKSSIYISKL
jgi:hypothetical protein